MAAMVALLRGINVGGRGTLPMARLRELAEGCGFTDVATYIQSGNVVFRAPGADAGDAARALAEAVASGTDVAPTVTVRTADQLAAVVADDPFLARGADPAHLHVVFLGPGEQAALPDDLAAFAPEEARVVGSEVHLLLPGGMGRSKLGARATRVGTARNWRTVTTLLDLVQARA